MTFEAKSTLAIMSFLLIGLLIYPMLTSTQWDELDFNKSTGGEYSKSAAPIDWRSLIND